MDDEMRALRTALGMLWAMPYTLLGLMLGLAGLATGGKARIRGKTIEFHGGFVRWFVAHQPPGEFTNAMTLGHTILGQTPASLDFAREHELVHVAQYERWGPLFGPAYLGASVVLWLMGKDAYRDNPFEREAYAADERRRSGGDEQA